MSPRGTVWLDGGRAGRAHAGWGREVLRMSVVPAAWACLKSRLAPEHQVSDADRVWRREARPSCQKATHRELKRESSLLDMETR